MNKINLSFNEDVPFNLSEACTYLSCSKMSILRLRKKGILKSMKSGRKIFFWKKDLVDFLNSNSENND